MGDVHPVSLVTAVSVSHLPRRTLSPLNSESSDRGVGHPEQSLPDVGRADARSAQIGSCPLIAHSFQVSEYSGEPFTPSFARNLLAKDCWRLALADEVGEDRPQVPLVGGAKSFASGAEGLAGAASGPDGAINRPARERERVGPAPDAGEKMALNVSCEFIGLHLHDAALVHVPGWNVPLTDKLAQPSRRLGIILVVVNPSRRCRDRRQRRRRITYG